MCRSVFVLYRNAVAKVPCEFVVVVVPCEFVLSPMNPLRGSCVSDRSRCDPVRIYLELDKFSAEIVCVEAFSLWCRASLF